LHRVFEQLRVTLAINCSTEIKAIDSRPPLYRCRTLALDEYGSSNERIYLDKLLDMFRRSFDWIELERMSYDRLEESDPVPQEEKRRGRLGGGSVKVEKKTVKWPFGRVLLFSRLGFDRPCLICAAYLIRRYGLTVDQAIGVIMSARPGTSLNPHHITALQEWAAMYSLGDLYCDVCVKELTTGVASIAHPVLQYDNDCHVIQISDEFPAFQEEVSMVPALAKLGDPAMYLQQIFIDTSSKKAFFDLTLGGVGIDDTMVEALCSALDISGVMPIIRRLALPNNAIGSAGATTLASALVSAGSAEDGGELLFLDLSHNK